MCIIIISWVRVKYILFYIVSYVLLYFRTGDIFIVHTHTHIHKPEVVVCENYSMKSTYIYIYDIYTHI